jgi:hypothetical protein
MFLKTQIPVRDQDVISSFIFSDPRPCWVENNLNYDGEYYRHYTSKCVGRDDK